MIFMKQRPVELEDLDAEQKEILHAAILDFVKSGIVLTAADWERMEPAERVMYRFVKSGGVEAEFDALNRLADSIEGKGKVASP